MGRYIVKINDYYLEWSSIVDAPVTFGMSLQEFEEYHREEYGRDGHRDFERRMARVGERGTSSIYGATPEDIIIGNRAGPDESELTFDEIYEAYCLRQSVRDGWVIPAHEEGG